MGSGGGGDYPNPSRGGPGLGNEDIDHHRNQRNRPNPPSGDTPRDTPRDSNDHHRGGGGGGGDGGGGHDRGGDRERYGSGSGGLVQGDGPTRPFVHDHDDATPSLLMRNLPPDVTCAELVTLITKHTSCRYSHTTHHTQTHPLTHIHTSHHISDNDVSDHSAAIVLALALTTSRYCA